ncbi:hypothetical protein D3C76_1481450 [compost metagenome]
MLFLRTDANNAECMCAVLWPDFSIDVSVFSADSGAVIVGRLAVPGVMDRFVAIEGHLEGEPEIPRRQYELSIRVLCSMNV